MGLVNALAAAFDALRNDTVAGCKRKVDNKIKVLYDSIKTEDEDEFPDTFESCSDSDCEHWLINVNV